MKTSEPKANSRKTSLLLGALGLGMFAFGFAMVPLYDLICSVAGINGIATASQRAGVELTQIDRTRLVTVEFDATLNAGLPWKIERPSTKIKVHPGALNSVIYKATNLSTDSITVQAIPGITPWQATEFFAKTECFCFETQTLAPGESRDMNLQFMVDHKLPEKFGTITLSYTFMNTDRASNI